MAESRNSERRNFPRFHLHQVIELDMGREEIIHATGENLSIGGLLCESDEAVEPYTSVYVMIGLPQSDGGNVDVKTEGVVLRCIQLEAGGYSLGIQFTDLTPEDISTINEYIEHAGTGDA